MEPGTVRYRFDRFLFDPATGELRWSDGAARLPPKPARLLTLLLARGGELVARDTLRDELWPGQHVELDQSLGYTVRQVRAALGDDGAEPRLVETLPRRGYRMLVAVEQVAGKGAATSAPGSVRAPLAGSTKEPEAGAGAAGAPQRASPAGRRRVRLLVGAIAALALLALFAGKGGRRQQLAAMPPAPVRIALLPLGEPGDEAANDPLTEGLVEALTAQPGIDLVGPATTGGLRGTKRPHSELGRALGVAFVASGGYRAEAGFLFLQLVRVDDGKHVFAHRSYGAPAQIQRQLPAAAAALARVAARGERPGAAPG